MSSPAELQALFTKVFPQFTAEILSVDKEHAKVRQEIDDAHLRPGGTVSGPVLVAVADAAAYVSVLGAIGIVPLAVTSGLNIAFLAKPSAARALVAEATMLKVGRTLAVIDVKVFSEGEPKPVATATVTYSIPINR